MRNCYILTLALVLPCVVGASFEGAIDAYSRKDFTAAHELFLELAEEGELISQFNVGVMYEEGLGVARDYAEAARWYRKSALQDYSPAQFNLGNLYRFGRGVAEDHAAAFRWWRSAAELGHAAAQHNVGLQYYMGDVIPKDVRKGREWLRRANANGSEASRKLLAIIDPDADREPDPGAGSANPARREKSARAPSELASTATPALEQGVGASGAELSAPAIRQADRARADGAPQRESWILQQPGGHYTLALMAGVDEKAVVAFLARHPFAERTAYFRFTRGTTNWYEAISGSFAERDDAVQALRQLSAAIRKNKPWITRFHKLHKAIRETQ